MLVGDGTYFMNPMELITALQEKLKITVIISENHGFQVIRRHLNFFESQDPARSFWNFNAEFTNNTAGAGGSPIASLLLGYPTQITRAGIAAMLIWF